ncbi:MAG: sigma-E processing peptidase SpoIIGA [Clostridia bacterium]|nr:sigma-E processing peptidase SpoIIGA [Clostridia bacterium]
MPIYADSVFLINYLSNALLLYSYCFFYGIKRRHKRIAAASALCGAYATTEAILDLPHVIRIAVFILLVLTAFGRHGLMRHGSRLMLMCFAVEGITLAAVSALGAGARLAQGSVVLFASEPVCAVIFVSAYPAFTFGMRLAKKRRRYLYLNISRRGRSAHVKVLRDSGNLLRYRNRPVIMVAWDAVSGLFDHDSYSKLNENAGTYAVYRTLNGAGTVPIIEDASCTADGIISNAAIGVVEKRFKGRYSGVAGDI